MSKRGKGTKCHYCQRTLNAVGSPSALAATRDHLHPRSQGGRATVWCCQRCNQLKGDMTLLQWHVFMAENPEWWKLQPGNLRTARRALDLLREKDRVRAAHQQAFVDAMGENG